jgi:hypothetical protein
MKLMEARVTIIEMQRREREERQSNLYSLLESELGLHDNNT